MTGMGEAAVRAGTLATVDDRVISEVSTGKSPTSISALPNGHQTYVTDENDGPVEVLNILE